MTPEQLERMAIEANDRMVWEKGEVDELDDREEPKEEEEEERED